MSTNKNGRVRGFDDMMRRSKKTRSWPRPTSSSDRVNTASDTGSSSFDVDSGQDFNESTKSRKRARISPNSSNSPVEPQLIESDVVNQFPDQDEAATEVARAAIPETIAEAQDKASLASRTSFATLGVAPWLVASLSAMQIRRPTTIQAGCIPEIIKGRDCIGGSKTGSGKTVAFAIPILHQWARDPTGIYAVVLTPTRYEFPLYTKVWQAIELTLCHRELALQIHEQFLALGAPHSLKVCLVTGGSDQTAQAVALSRRPHIVIATPGRLADHIRTSGDETVSGLRRARFVVLDEADRLLAGGNGSMLPDVEECLGALPPANERQTCLFTATVTPEVRGLKDRPCTPGKPELFMCETETRALAVPKGLKQTYLLAPVMQRECYLHILLLTPANEKKSIIIFTNRTSTSQLLEHMLRLLDHRVTALHSGLPQKERVSNLARFRARAARILVATDVASRGLDIPDVEAVINYDVPRNPDDYVHRVGRTARAGRKGVSVTMMGQRDVELVLAIEQRVGNKMHQYEEGEAVNMEARVIRDGLKSVGEKKREAMLQIEQGMNVSGTRKRMKLKPVERGA